MTIVHLQEVALCRPTGVVHVIHLLFYLNRVFVSFTYIIFLFILYQDLPFLNSVRTLDSILLASRKGVLSIYLDEQKPKRVKMKNRRWPW